MDIIFSVDRQFYVLPSIPRECGLWLSVETFPFPVSPEWHRPGLNFAALMRGRNYYRIGSGAPVRPGPTEQIDDTSDLITDYRTAIWWTPGIEETWAELDGMHIAMCEAHGQIDKLTQLHVCETGKDKKGSARA